MNNEIRLTISGFGGQGVMALGQALTSYFLHEGKEVIWVPSYGPEMRGGTANCSVIISDSKIGSPVVNISDISVAFNKPSFLEFENRVKSGGIFIVNSSLVDEEEGRKDIDYKYIPADTIAKELGNEKMLNMTVFGYVLKQIDHFNISSVEKAFVDVFGEKANKLWDTNKKAILTGYEY